jgi:aryl-alcohol dehydrogenase-like predicted oxidoreductase
MYTLGQSDLHLQRPIAFGCMSLKTQEPADERLLRYAADQGIQLFDTADLYQQGANEILVGKALAPIRKDIVLSTKIGNKWRSDGSGWDWNPHKDYLISAVEKSLKRLKTDYIDLCFLHGGTIDDPIDEIIETFDMLIEQGKIRHYGLSSIRPNVIRPFIEKSRIVALMTPYSLLDRRADEQIWNWLNKANVSAICRGVTAQGKLLNKKEETYLDYDAVQVKQIREALFQIAHQYNVTPLGLLIHFSRSPEPVQLATIGIRNMSQLQEAIHAMQEVIEIKTLPASLLELLHDQYFDAHRISSN